LKWLLILKILAMSITHRLVSLSRIIEKGTLTDEKICYRYQCFHRAISPKNKYHLIFESLINRKFDLRISNEILLEYEEIISQKYNSQHLEKFLGFIAFSPHVIPCPPPPSDFI